MVHKGSRKRPTLGQGLDREVYQIVRKFIDELDQFDDGRPTKISINGVYERIKKSNSSLNRRPKKQLEDSIERVLEVIKEEAPSDEDDLGDIEGEFDGIGIEEEIQRTSGLNRSIVDAWSKAPQALVQRNGAEPAMRVDAQATSETPSSKKRSATGEPPSKKRKATPAVDRSPPTHVSLADLGGVDAVIKELEDLIVLPLLQPQIYTSSRIQPPRGILLHGPPGCGKTMIANAFAAEVGVPFIALSAPSIVSGMSGESEKALREHFDEAKKLAPCLIFIDEIDAITPKRESAQREMEKRIVAQLLTCMDDLDLEKTGGKAVIVLAATNRPDSLDPALRRGGRFDKEINMSVPSEPVREQILRALTREMAMADDIDFKQLAKATPGFVGADLNDLVSTAGATAIKRLLDKLKKEAPKVDAAMDIDPDPSAAMVSPQLAELRRLIATAKNPLSSNMIPPSIHLTATDFALALPKIQPSSKREGFATIPDTTFSAIGALSNIREELLTAIVRPILSPEKYSRVGITAPSGVLLWGPPGCGKTLLAKAVANESRANFISVKGPELLNKYVGESERAVRQVFVRARSSVPCVIFFDELDALVPRRDDAVSESSARVVNTLLTELDGLDSRKGIYVVAATNRPDIIDPAMLRPGRLETLLFVDLPGPEERVEILATLIRNGKILTPKREDAREEFMIGVAAVARACDGFSGADLASLLRRAGYVAVKRDDGDGIRVEDFAEAKTAIRPSVAKGDRGRYEKLRGVWGNGV
ncbi:hypothetical protein MMC25_002037 [Agyrium rufum]|nr:hypothetical protein [Agyrium rufum]